jgi:small subunit ribosomal protein S2
VFVIDPKKEKNAIREARALGVTTVALIDTDCNPDDVDLPIPGNDDGIRSIEVVLRHLADAVLAGSAAVQAQQKDQPGKGRDNKDKDKDESMAEASAK